MRGVKSVSSKHSDGFNASALAAELLRDGLMVHMKVHGQSMRPTLKDGDTVVLAPLPESPSVVKGDILFYLKNTGSTALLHRALRIYAQSGERFVITRGDAMLGSDSAIRISDVPGKVVEIRPSNSRAIHQNTPGWTYFRIRNLPEIFLRRLSMRMRKLLRL